MTEHTAEEIYEFGLEHLTAGHKDAANAKFEEVLLLKPDHAKAYALRGSIAAEQGRPFDAMMNYTHALTIAPSPECLNNLGVALGDLNQWERAQACFLKSVQMKPDFHRGWNNLGRQLLIGGSSLDEVKDCFRKSIAIDGNYVEPHMGLAFVSLEQGDFETGWTEYEWRRKLVPLRHETLREWRGESLNDDEGIVLSSEQGIGDVVQFCRYAPLLKQTYGGKVYLESRPSLYRLLKTLHGIDGVISYGDPVPEGVKYHKPMMSCPFIFGTTLDTIPSQHSYLSALPTLVAIFAAYTEAFREGTPRVGICWAGNAGLPSTDRRRSTNLVQWKPLAEVPGIGWLTLQKGPPAVQLRSTQIGMTILDLIGDCDDMADTAALIENCDLVITVDTAIAHVAAALGKPTWVLSRRDACWRWLGDRRDSPWYPTIRHYRQKKRDDWTGLMAEVAVDLQTWLTEWHACQKL